MGKDTIADLLTSIRNADMNKKGTVRVVSTNITENIVKILLREEKVLLSSKTIGKVTNLSWHVPLLLVFELVINGRQHRYPFSVCVANTFIFSVSSSLEKLKSNG